MPIVPPAPPTSRARPYRPTLWRAFVTLALCIAVGLGVAWFTNIQNVQSGLTGTDPTLGDGFHHPAMGWNHYNHFLNAVDAQTILAVATAMAHNGMKAAGYTYVNIDDSWETDHRAPDGSLLVNSAFGGVAGIKQLANQIHALGLKFGIYTSPAARTCDPNVYHVGSEGHVLQDVQSFADWGVDYIKLDYCSATGDPATIARAWHDAIVKAGRPMVLSINVYWAQPWTWAPAAGVNMWRTGPDICEIWTAPQRDNTYRCYDGNSTRGVLDVVENPNLLASATAVSQGHYSDPDMLEIGNGGLSYTEEQAQFSIWCMLSAPLIAGNDPRQMTGSDDASRIMLQRDLIAIDQDAANIQGKPFRTDQGLAYWLKPLADGSKAVMLLNTDADAQTMRFNWNEIGLPGGATTVHDLWAGTSQVTTNNQFSATVPSHGVIVLRLTAQAHQAWQAPARQPVTAVVVGLVGILTERRDR